METVEVLVRIPKDKFEMLTQAISVPNEYKIIRFFKKVLKNGTVLPKGHGRLVDAEKIARAVNRAWTLWEKKGENCYLFSDVLTPLLVSQPTVIEADREADHEC